MNRTTAYEQRRRADTGMYDAAFFMRSLRRSVDRCTIRLRVKESGAVLYSCTFFETDV